MSFNSKFKSREIEDILDKSKVYIFPFTTQDIIDATEQDIPYRLLEEQIAEILDAINTKKRILIRQYPDVEGYNVIDSIFWDDMIYVHFIDLFSSYPATSCNFAIDMSAMNVTDFRMGIIATESNLKTINGESILGSGDIVVSGGGKEYVEVVASSGSIYFVGNEYRPSFEPNKIYYATVPIDESVVISSVTPPTEDVGEYTLYFDTMITSNAFIGQLDLPSEWMWTNGEIPTLEKGLAYELSVVATKSGSDFIYKAVLTPFKSV